MNLRVRAKTASAAQAHEAPLREHRYASALCEHRYVEHRYVEHRYITTYYIKSWRTPVNRSPSRARPNMITSV
jgi:hypothetical protein